MDIYCDYYNNFIEQLQNIFTDDKTKEILNNSLLLSNEIKYERGLVFSSKINEIDFNSFYNSKIKIFSHKNDDTYKISQSLFGAELCIKNLLNNQSIDIQNVIWKHLHILWYYSINKNEDLLEDNIKLMKTKLYNENKLELFKTDAKKKICELLGDNINSDIYDMIDDIIKCFEDLILNFNNNSMASIVKISQELAVKYSNKIKNGNIELDKILEIIFQKIPGLSKMFSSFKNMKKTNNNETIIIDESFSTSNIEIGEEDKGMDLSSLKIGSILKMADKIGILPNLPNSTSSSSNNNLLNLNIENISDNLTNIFNNSNMDNIDDMQSEMTNLIKEQLGLDISEINSELQKLITSNEE
jgi:hypothetical protein